MYKTYRKLIAISVGLVIFTSCEKDNEIGGKTIAGEVVKEVNITNEYRLLDYTINKYHDYFKTADNIIGFNNLKSGFQANYSLVENIDLKNKNLKTVMLDNKKIVANGTKNELNLEEFEIFGKTISISINNNKNEENSQIIEMYIPEKLEISKPVAEAGKSVYAYYKNFIIEWNADFKNDNGLMVAVEYSGETVGQKNSEKHLQVIDYIEEDNGKFILKETMFDDIPNLSFIEIVLLRGNIDINELDGETYKTYAEAHQRIPVLLIKDLDSVISSDEQ
jgi:hypothetical protein